MEETEQVELWSVERAAPGFAAAMGFSAENGSADTQYLDDSTSDLQSQLPTTWMAGPQLETTGWEQPSVERVAAETPVLSVPARDSAAGEAAYRSDEEEDERGPEWLLGMLADPWLLARMAERLYPAVRRRLRSELLIDRERRGALADLR